jgi:rhodanese-related sulfurtransferase
MRNFMMGIILSIVFLLAPLSILNAHHVDDISRISKEKVLEMMDQPDVLIIDSRSTEEYDKASQKIKGGMRLNLLKLADFMADVPKSKTLVFYCNDHDEYLSASAALKLLQKGYKDVHALKGGWDGWHDAGYPVDEK